MKPRSYDCVFPLLGGTPIQKKDAPEGVRIRQIHGTAGVFTQVNHRVKPMTELVKNKVN